MNRTLRMPGLCSFLLLLACQGAVITPAGECDSTSSTHPEHARYSELLAQDCKDSRAPGCLVLIDRPGEPLWVGTTGFSNLESGTSMCPSTPMRIGSITKVFMATVIMKLVEEDKLSLSDRLSSVLPEVAGRIPMAEQITVRHLLAHRSGLPSPATQDVFLQTDYFDRPGELTALPLEERLRRYVYDRPLRFPPGTAYSYSNPGYDLLGLIAQRVEQAPLQAVMERIILQPLGLTHSSLERRDNPEIARGYLYTGEGLLMDVTTHDKAVVGPLSPSGGMVSTAEDVRRLFRALFAGQIISRNSLEVMQAGQGLFAFTAADGLGSFGHSGALIGERSWALYFPQRDTVIILMKNVSDGASNDLTFMDQLAR
jgi:D-alanyl-D-alanine carboxypeptidase